MITSTPPKERDVESVVRYLTSTFEKTCRGLERPLAAWTIKTGFVANDTYRLQREFAYFLHELTIGPKSVVQRSISDCNNLINEVLTKRNQTS